MAARGSGGVEHSFQFKAGDYIGKTAVTVISEVLRIVFLEPDSDDYRSGVDFDLFGFHFQIYSFDIAGFHT